METNESIESDSQPKIKRQQPISDLEAQELSNKYISFTETSASKDRTVRRISLPINELMRLLKGWEDEHYTVTIAVGRTVESINIVMLGAGDTSSAEVWVDCYDVFPEASVGRYGDDSGQLFCPPPAVCRLY